MALMQHIVTRLTGSQTIGYLIGDYIIESASPVAIILPDQSLGVWYRFYNNGSADATVDAVTIRPSASLFVCSDGVAWRYFLNDDVTSVTGTGAIAVTSGKTPQVSHLDTEGYKHIPAGGDVDQVLVNNGAGAAEWAEPPAALPPGGSVGQTLVKQSGDDGDADWADEVIQAGQVKEQNLSGFVKLWTGTMDEYVAIETPDSDTLYFVYDEEYPY